MGLSDFARYPLLFGPSPVHRLDRLTGHLGGAAVWAKREDVNSGIAFGLFASATSIVIFLTVLAVIWMLTFFARSGARHPVLPVGLGLVLGGSISNLVYRVRLGYVTDFLDVGPWPAFNLADSFIVAGVAVLVMTLLSLDRPAASRS